MIQNVKNVLIMRRKHLIPAAIVTALTLWVTCQHISFMPVYYFFNKRESIACYRIQENTLDDISTKIPKNGKSIFFHETSCSSYLEGKIVLNPRQACAVESAARMNPTYDVYVLFTSPGIIKLGNNNSDKVLEAVLSYNNVKLKHLNFFNYTAGTAVENLYKKGQLENSHYARSHASDVLRYLTLWKYGGIYLDLDVVVIKPLAALPANFAGRESDRNVAAGVMGFSHEGIGHVLAEQCLNDLRNNFRGSDWGYNGPGVITRLLNRTCKGIRSVVDMQPSKCSGFKVYPPSAFYAIPWWNWTMYFDEEYMDYVMDQTKNSMVVHVWNQHSSKRKVPVGSRVPYGLIAQKYCPKVYTKCGDFF